MKCRRRWSDVVGVSMEVGSESLSLSFDKSFSLFQYLMATKPEIEAPDLAPFLCVSLAPPCLRLKTNFVASMERGDWLVDTLESWTCVHACVRRNLA